MLEVHTVGGYLLRTLPANSQSAHDPAFRSIAVAQTTLDNRDREDVAQLAGESFGLAGVSGIAPYEAPVMAGEDRRLLTK